RRRQRNPRAPRRQCGPDGQESGPLGRAGPAGYSCKFERPIIVFMLGCVASASGHHLCNRLSHSVSVTGSTGTPEAERPEGRKQPAQVKSGGKLEPTRGADQKPNGVGKTARVSDRGCEPG